MNHVILQPSGGAGKANFDNTIKSPVPLEKIILSWTRRMFKLSPHIMRMG